jgi:hypothetical protein
MNLNRILMGTLALLPLLLGACYNHKREELNAPISSCATIETTYSGFVGPVVQNTCLSCHGSSVAPSSGRGVDLEGYANFRTWANDPRLMRAIRWEGAFHMPQGGAKLDDCTIARFRSWIDAGTPNN